MKPWVVIPTYNEKDNIEEMVRAIFALAFPDLKLLIVDDNSPDGTADLIRTLQKEFNNLELLVRQKKEGLGPAYIHGFKHALELGATHIVQMDADFSHDPKDVPKLLDELTNGADVALGSRYIHGLRVINWPLRRLVLSAAANKYVHWVTGLPYFDGTGGFRAWKKEALDLVDLDQVKADGYGFQIVMIYRAWKKKCKVSEIPIIFTERREGQSKMTWKISLEALWLVLRLRLLGK